MKRVQSMLRSLIRWESMQIAGWEAYLLRLIFAYWLMASLPTRAGAFEGTPHPHGAAHFMDLSFMHDAGTVTWLSRSAMIALILGAIGIAEPIAIGWTLAVIIMAKSYNQSQGHIGHAGQLHTLCLLAWWLSSLWVKDWRRALWGNGQSWARQVQWIVQTIAATYTVSAITKLMQTDGEWMTRGANFVLQMVKAQDEGLSTRATEPSALAVWILERMTQHPWLGSAMLTSAWVLEFTAFIALLNRRASLLVGMGLLTFHLGTDLLMGIGFHSHQRMLWLFLVNPLFWAWWASPRLRLLPSTLTARAPFFDPPE
jgi:hypothetical protein